MITIPQIIFFFLKRNVSPENIPNRSVFGKAYHQWLNTEWFFPENYKFNQISLNGAPLPYELQFCLSNAGDCADWLKDNDKNLNDFIIPKITTKHFLTNDKQLVTI
jgi:hypothetical protein